MMRGWKTWLAAAGLCGMGIFLILQDNEDLGTICILNGLGLVGIGSKVDKARVYPVSVTLNGHGDKP